MSLSVSGLGTRTSVTAIAQQEGALKAVELRKQAEVPEIIWAKSTEGSDANWYLFARECGLPADQPEQTKTGRDKMVVVGFGSTGVAFYRIGLPVAKKEELAAMIKLQAETLLPLPADQMELSWRAGRERDGEVPITVAATRRQRLQGYVEKVRPFQPAKILLDCEAIVKAWSTFFSGREKDAVVVSLQARSTQICLVEDGLLSNAVVIDMGREDFPEDQDTSEQTDTTERLIQDIKSALASFGYSEPVGLPVFVLSDGSSAIAGIVSCLKSAGLNARVALPDADKLVVHGESGTEQLYEYRVPIGLAMMALDDDAELNIAQRLYHPAGTKPEKPGWYSPRIAGVIAAVMFVVLVAVSYAVDLAYEKRLSRLEARPGFKELVQRQTLIKAVAQQRPDLLELLSEINSAESQGIMLDSFYFKKGQPVRITGQAQGKEQLYKFEESLQNKKSIDIVATNPSVDTKTKRIKFTMTFHYKNFTRKST